MSQIRRFIVTALVEVTDGTALDGWSVRGVEFKNNYIDEVLESSVIEIAPWSDDDGQVEEEA